jgi:hypothetical protein
MVIYKTTNLINGKFYIGKDEKNNPNYIGSGLHLIRAIEKYGKHNFSKEIIDTASSREELNEKEIYWIEQTNAIKLGYNIAPGGTGGNVLKDASVESILEWKRKIGIKASRKRTDEERAAISKGRLCITFSEEHKENIKKSRANQIITEEHKKNISKGLTGRIQSEETKEKISIANKGKVFTKEHREKIRKNRATQTPPTQGKKCMNNGIINVFVNVNQINEYLKDGYTCGMIKLKK